MLNHAEILLSTVQNLRSYILVNPHARGNIDTIERGWLPVELFPPERAVLVQAINVLVNAGELVGLGDVDNPVYYAKEPLEKVAGY